MTGRDDGRHLPAPSLCQARSLLPRMCCLTQFSQSPCAEYHCLPSMEEVPGAQRRSTPCARSPVWRGGCERGHSAPSLAPPSSAQPAKGSRFPHLADGHAEAQGGEALAQGHGSVSGRAEMLTQAPQPGPGAQGDSAWLWEGLPQGSVHNTRGLLDPRGAEWPARAPRAWPLESGLAPAFQMHWPCWVFPCARLT